ncbi:SDR family NAD(P)-dependent oxidoreductase [Streptomyces sp. NPDC059568]|uniref:SDR family NAD(P)-dependent oxidoreductase n=1 Tax=Streptomyces sp. NPDC059568 TaxID=3346868 RepID=UPI0036A9CD75
MSTRLDGRHALVTGSTDGIGVAIAHALADEGARVVVSGRNVERGERVAAAIADQGGDARFVAADLSSRAGVQALARSAGTVDILVNNAAMLIPSRPTAEIPEELLDAALATNVKAAFLLTGLLAPAMAARGGGAIVNVGSINGLIGRAHSALYSATKAAVHSLTKSWAAEYGPSGVRVNTVAPGPTLTEKTSQVRELLEQMVQRAPAQRLSTPEEVAAAVVFLAGDGAANIHGSTLSVDGGLAGI